MCTAVEDRAAARLELYHHSEARETGSSVVPTVVAS